MNLEPEVNRQASSHPSAKPPVDANEPLQHPGSFSDESLEARVSTPRKRDEIPLPHWPFQDDLDLVGHSPFDESSDVTDASRSAFSSVPAPTVSKAEAELSPVPKPTRLYFSAQVAQAPAPEASPPVTTADAVPLTPPAEQVPAPQAAADNPSVAGTLTPEADPLYRLKTIHDIQPFHDYMPNGGDPNDVLCPRPANADPSKTYKQCPVESSLIVQGSLERNHSVIPVYWMASNVYHNPLYFEDPSLERNGHSFSDAVQPFVSVGKFGAQFIALPYSIALDPVWKKETPLGHYRPGECAPKRHLAVPINGAAAATAAAAYTGIIFLTP